MKLNAKRISRFNATLVMALGLSLAASTGIVNAGDKVVADGASTAVNGGARLIGVNRVDLAKQVLDRWQPIAVELGQNPDTWREIFSTQFGLMDASTLNSIAAVSADASNPAASYAGFTNAIRSAAMQMYMRTNSVKLQTKLGAAGSDLVYTPIVPCRLVDTRVVGGPLGAFVTRNWFYYTNTAGFNFGTFQGGAAGAAGTVCPGTFFPDNAPQFGAAMVTVTVVSPSVGPGNLIMWGGTGATPPATSALNWSFAGEVIANTTAVPGGGRSGSGPGGAILDFAVSNNSTGTAHVVVDVVGYFAASHATQLDCITTQLAGVGTANVLNNTEVDFTTAAACPAGYDGASISCQYSGSSPAGLALTQVGPPPPSAFFACIWRNQTGATLDKSRFFTTTSCCRLPGR